MNTKTKALFGGALLAAGVTANAQNFIYYETNGGDYTSFAYSYAWGGGSVVSYDLGDLNTYVFGSTPDDLGDAAAWTTQDSKSMRSGAIWYGGGAYGYGYAGSIVYQYFGVDQDAQMLIEWDFTETDGFTTVSLERGNGANLFYLSGGDGDAPFSGEQYIDLSAGEVYFIRFGLYVPLDSPQAGTFPFLFEQDVEKYIDVSLVQGDCLVDFNGDGLVDTRDFLEFLNLWSASDGLADFNGDGSINTQDVILFLNEWALGC